MKILLCLIGMFAMSANAEQIRNYNGMLIVKTETACYAFPPNVSPEAATANWTTFDEAAKAKNWPTVGGIPSSECPLDIYITPTRANYTDNPRYDTALLKTGKKKTIGRVPFNTVCKGEVVHSTSRTQYRELVGFTGAALCVKKN